MLSSTATLLMGNQSVSINILRQIASSSSKLFHGMVSSDLNPRDHQNYGSCVRISRDEIFRALENIDKANATMIYIKLLRSIIDAYIETSTSLLDRVFHAWTSVFISRLWLLWIEKMGKRQLDNLFIKLTKDSNEYDNLPKSSAQYFLTPQAVYSIELNAHCLIFLILLVIEGKLPEEVLRVDQFHSQTCESIFRSARALSSNLFAGVNFTVHQFLNLSDKLSLFQKIRNQHEQIPSGTLRFPMHHKNKQSHSFPGPSNMKIPTQTEIEQTVVRAFSKATDYLEQVGVMKILSRNKLYDMVGLNDYARVLFEEKGILDHFSQENGDDEDDECPIDGSDANHDDDDDDDVFNVLRYPDDQCTSQPTIRTIRVCDSVPPHLFQSYFKVRINSKEKFIHKSTACWVLTEQNRKLSADRTKRVTQTK